MKSTFWAAATGAVMALGVAVACAEIPRAGLPQNMTLQSVLDRIHDHASNETWKQAGFQDEHIEAWLDRLVGSVAKAAEFPELTLPVRLSGVRSEAAAAAEQPNRLPVGVPIRIVQSRLVIGRDVDLKDAALKKSIIFADGSVTVGRVEECIIVARGAVTTTMASSSSIIVSGVYIKLGQYDGMPQDTNNGSLVVSRGWADVVTAYGTLIAAREGITVGRPEGVTFLNAPVPAPPNVGGIPLGRENNSRSVKVPDLAIEPLPEHPLTSRIELVGVSHSVHSAVGGGFLRREQRVFGPRGIVFRFNERIHVAEVGEPIVDEEGQPVEGLADWRLSCIGPKFALLIGPEANAVLRLERKL
jgi:hypothetical protein